MDVGCSNKHNNTIAESGDFNSYQIAGLEPGNRYTITVRATNDAGSSHMTSNALTATTNEIGKRD